MKIKPPVRTSDSWGQGHFGASRGHRRHNGIDYACYPGSTVLSDVYGVVTKLGYPYADDLSFRYVEVTDSNALRHRYFYVEPCVAEGDVINRDSVIGHSQSLDDRYPGITEHVHYEVKNPKDEYLNPGDL